MEVKKNVKAWIKKNAVSVILFFAGFIFWLSTRKGVHGNSESAERIKANNRNAKESAERAGRINSELKSGIERAEQILSEIEATGKDN